MSNVVQESSEFEVYRTESGSDRILNSITILDFGLVTVRVELMIRSLPLAVLMSGSDFVVLCVISWIVLM